MTGDVPVTLAGTAPVWTPRSPDMRFDIGHEGRLRQPLHDTYPKGNTGPKPTKSASTLAPKANAAPAKRAKPVLPPPPSLEILVGSPPPSKPPSQQAVRETKLHDTLTRIRQFNKRLAALRFD